MENNYVNLEPHVDPGYEEKAKTFLTKAIVACAIASLPIGSIVAIIMGSGNRTAILDYLNQGGIHTTKIQVSSALSRASKYAGIAYTIVWAFYALYMAFFLFMVIAAAVAGASR
ncbi:MAG: hypothetical protein J5778_04610 [Clostridiales bacterium]|nr:hypothetical protein [Clostridiales bacterium]